MPTARAAATSRAAAAAIATPCGSSASMAGTVGMPVLAVHIGAMQQLELAATLTRVTGLSRTEKAPVQNAAALATGQALGDYVVGGLVGRLIRLYRRRHNSYRKNNRKRERVEGTSVIDNCYLGS